MSVRTKLDENVVDLQNHKINAFFMLHLHRKLLLQVGQICKINCSLDHIDLIAIFGFAKLPTIFSPWPLKCFVVYVFMWNDVFKSFFYQFKWIIKNVLESDFIIISRAPSHQDFYPKFDPNFYFRFFFFLDFFLLILVYF